MRTACVCRAADRPAKIHSRDELHTCVSASVILRCYLRQPPPPITTHTPAACLWGSGWVLKRISCCEWTILVRDVIRNRCQVGSTWFPWQQQNPQMRRALLPPPLPPCLSVSPLQVEARDRDSARRQKAEQYDMDPPRVHNFSILNKLYDPLTL